jgi:hypothetical protein
VELVGRWWNGARDGPGRRDIWLHRDGQGWRVRARDGGAAGRDLSWPAFHEEWVARAWIDRLIAASPEGRDGWKDVIKLVRKPPDGGWSARYGQPSPPAPGADE